MLPKIKTVLPEINFKPVTTPDFMERENPSQSDQILARIGLSTQEMAETAIQESQKAFHIWKKTSADYIAWLKTNQEIFGLEAVSVLRKLIRSKSQ